MEASGAEKGKSKKREAGAEDEKAAAEARWMNYSVCSGFGALADPVDHSQGAINTFGGQQESGAIAWDLRESLARVPQQLPQPTADDINERAAQVAERRKLRMIWGAVRPDLPQHDSPLPASVPGNLVPVVDEQLKTNITWIEEHLVQDSDLSSSPSATEPRTLIMPKNFHLTRAYDMEDYRKAVVVCRNRLSTSCLNPPLELKALIDNWLPGFVMKDLVQKCALTMPSHIRSPDLRCNLDIPVLPIFAFEKWEDIPRNIYDALEPSLRLASWFVTHWSCAPYWHTVAVGRREPEPYKTNNGPQITGDTPRYRFRTICDWTSAGEAALANLLQAAAETINFYFSNKPHSYAAFGLYYRVAEKGGKRVQHRIVFSPDFLICAEAIATGRLADPLQLMRFNLHFAVVLCHELAHLLENVTRRREHPNAWGRPETYWHDYPWAEAGLTWELTMFGGSIKCIDRRADALYGLCRVDNEIPSEPLWRGYSISMEQVWKLQRKEFYPPEQNQYTGWRHFHLPKDDAAVCVAYHGLQRHPSPKEDSEQGPSGSASSSGVARK